MTVPISQFYPLLLVVWAVLFWCKSRVFRVTLLVSLALHAVFLVRLSGWGTGSPRREPIVSFTFVQGGEEPQKAPPREEIGLSPALTEVEREAARRDSKAVPESRPEGEERPTPPQESRVEKDLPPIKDPSLLTSPPDPLAESYRRQLQRLIARHQKTTPELLERGFEGRVQVWFNLSRDGKLNPPVFADARIRSSRDSVNRAAVDTVMAAAEHFPPFPAGVNRAEIWFHVFVDFSNVRFSED
jgi:hypothetical protein